jgi:multiple sugar transport system permease protein
MKEKKLINGKTKFQLTIQEIKNKKALYFMMLPFLVLFFTFTILPVGISIVLSFTNFDMVQTPSFVGFDNYIFLLFQDDVFSISIKNTLILAIFTGPISYLLAFFFAWLINELPRKLRLFMTLIFYAPSISGNVFLLWSLIFSPDMYGYLNGFLLDYGIINEPVQWLTTKEYIMPILIIVQLWLSLGVSFLAFIAGLQKVDKTLYEAAAIDGIRNRWQELWFVTLPQMKPMLLFGAIMQITSSLSIANVSTALAGNPSVEYAGHTILIHLMDYGNTKMEMGYASAIATVLFVIMLACNLLVQKILRRVGH